MRVVTNTFGGQSLVWPMKSSVWRCEEISGVGFVILSEAVDYGLMEILYRVDHYEEYEGPKSQTSVDSDYTSVIVLTSKYLTPPSPGTVDIPPSISLRHT